MNIILCEYLQYNETNYLRKVRQHLRDVINPFIIEEAEFIKIYRMPPSLVLKFCAELEEVFDPHLVKNIPLYIQFLATLSFYASGSYQRIVGQNFLNALSQSAVSRVITNISFTISTKMGKIYIKFPKTQREMLNTQNDFKNKFDNWPGILGIVDGTHVALTNLKKDFEIGYTNRKHFQSLNVQIICNSKMEIINVNSKNAGSNHDSFVFTCSGIYKTLKSLHQNQQIPAEGFAYLLSDSGYEILPWLVKKYARPQNDNQERFNRKLIVIRNSVERCIGVLKNRFRCLLKCRALHYTPRKAGHIINSSVVLHNFLIKNNYTDLNLHGEDYIQEEDVNGNILERDRRNVTQYYRQLGNLNRENLLAHLLNHNII